MNMHARHTDQDIIQQDLTDNPADQCIHRDPLVMQSLQNRTGCLNHRKQDHSQTLYHQKLGCDFHFLDCQSTVVEKGNDFPGQQAHACRARKTNKECKAQTKITLTHDAPAVIDGTGAGYGRNQAHGNGECQSSRYIDQTDHKS